MALDIKKLHEMTYEELEKINQQLMEKRSEVKRLQLGVTAEMDRKVVSVRMKAKAATLSDPEKAALVQVLSPKGIPSGERVGTPGS